jgi:hypothetical protein
MAATAGIFHAIRTIKDGEATFLGTTGLSKVLKETNVTLRKNIFRAFTLVPGESINIWNQLSDPSFAFFSLRVVEDGGVLQTRMYLDNPISESNLTASGVDPKWIPWLNIRCQSPMILTDFRIANNPTDGDFVGVDGSGLPLIDSDPGTVSGVLYRLRVKNVSASDVTAELIVLE